MSEELDPKSLWSISYGVFVVSSHDGKTVGGQIANTVIQVAAEPPRIAVAINKGNYTHGLIEKSGVFAVNVLREDTPMKFIGQFGFRSGRDADKLEGVEHEEGATGCPVVTENAVSVFEAKVLGKVDVGTHDIYAADVVSGRVVGGGTPLTYAKYHEMKGKAPRAAPTYRAPEEESQKKGDGKMQKYVCGVCGYVYDPDEGDPDSGVEPGTAFENLPDDWVCPVCGAEKSEFSPE